MDNKFPEKDSIKLAEFVGILLGDGCLGVYKCSSNGRKTIQYRVQITTNSVDDKEYIEYIENLIEELFSVKPRKYFRKGEKTCDIRLFGKKFIDFLTNDIGLNLSPKWERAKIPKLYLKNDLELLILRGYMDTDGCLTITNNNGILYPQLEMKISPSPMQMQLKDILKRRGFRFQTNDIGKGKIRVRINGYDQIKKWKNEVGFSNSKHLKKYLNFKTMKKCGAGRVVL